MAGPPLELEVEDTDVASETDAGVETDAAASASAVPSGQRRGLGFCLPESRMLSQGQRCGDGGGHLSFTRIWGLCMGGSEPRSYGDDMGNNGELVVALPAISFPPGVPRVQPQPVLRSRKWAS